MENLLKSGRLLVPEHSNNISVTLAGVSERDIDGGYIVNGWLQYVHPEHAYRNARRNIEIPWVNGANELPYEIANGLAAGSDVLETFGYKRWLGPSGRIYVLKRVQAR